MSEAEWVWIDDEETGFFGLIYSRRAPATINKRATLPAASNPKNFFVKITYK